jgi:hypothetical protein
MFPLLTISEDRPRLPESAEKALYVPMGAASPLWFMFAGAAGAGVAYWWMTRWTRATNLEALFADAGQAAAEAGSAVEALVQPTAEVIAEVEPPLISEPEVAPEPASFVAAVEEAAAPVETAAEEALASKTAAKARGGARATLRPDGEASPE